MLAERDGLAPVDALRGRNAGSDAWIVLRNNGRGEMPVRVRLGAWARHGADPGEQQQEDQKHRPGRGYDAPASDLVVVGRLRAFEFNGIDHDLPHDVCTAPIR